MLRRSVPRSWSTNADCRNETFPLAYNYQPSRRIARQRTYLCRVGVYTALRINLTHSSRIMIYVLRRGPGEHHRLRDLLPCLVCTVLRALQENSCTPERPQLITTTTQEIMRLRCDSVARLGHLKRPGARRWLAWHDRDDVVERITAANSPWKCCI